MSLRFQDRTWSWWFQHSPPPRHHPRHLFPLQTTNNNLKKKKRGEKNQWGNNRGCKCRWMTIQVNQYINNGIYHLSINFNKSRFLQTPSISGILSLYCLIHCHAFVPAQTPLTVIRMNKEQRINVAIWPHSAFTFSINRRQIYPTAWYYFRETQSYDHGCLYAHIHMPKKYWGCLRDVQSRWSVTSDNLWGNLQQKLAIFTTPLRITPIQS